MKTVFATAFVRSLAGVAAMALLPIMQRGVVVGWKHASVATGKVKRGLANRAVAAGHARRHYRDIVNDLAKAA